MGRSSVSCVRCFLSWSQDGPQVSPKSTWDSTRPHFSLIFDGYRPQLVVDLGFLSFLQFVAALLANVSMVFRRRESRNTRERNQTRPEHRSHHRSSIHLATCVLRAMSHVPGTVAERPQTSAIGLADGSKRSIY